jgi:hypothetical protein
MLHSDPDLNQPHPPTPGQEAKYPVASSVEVTDTAYSEYVDYFGFDERERWYFPDGKQWIEFKKMTEGDRARFLKATRSDVHLNQRSGEARIPFDQSKERKELLVHSCTDWHMVRRGKNGSWEPVPFQNNGAGGMFAQWVDKANPAVLAQLEKAIRKANPWLLNEMSLEQIDKEIADLQELRTAAADREAAEKNS